MARRWIAGATKNRGGLHRSLGVPIGRPIPIKTINAAAGRGGTVGKQARLAKTLATLRAGKSAYGLGVQR